MQHNLKLILILIVVAGIGIMVILGSWLYGSYNQRMELFLATAERTLFDAIQETIQKKEGAGTLFPQTAARKKSRKLFTGAKGLPSHSKKLAAKIMEVYPNINSDSLSMVLDSLLLQERHIFMERRRGIITAGSSSAEPLSGVRVAMTLEPDAKPQQLLPNFLFGLTPLDSSALLDIEKTFKHGLEDNGIRTDFTMTVINADRSDMLPSDTTLTVMRIRPLFLDSIAENGLSIRPILIDPEKGKFITVRFNRPWQYLLYNLSWQLMISVALIAIIIGCFVYLFHTIFKQNKLAILRKAFVNNMTHELRTPVATVSAAVQALQNYVEVGDQEHRDLYLSISKEELDHLSVMIDNVLHVAEDEHHTTYKLQYQFYDIITLIKKCISSIQIQDSDKQLDFAFNPTNTVEMVYGDPEHIKNVITNLLENAVKYGATQISIFTGVDRKNQFVVLRITDNGMGIPYAYQHQVFEPFFRVPQGNLHNVKGFGLGLSYVKQVVLQHGGHIQLKSVPNEGSSFTLSIPKTATL